MFNSVQSTSRVLPPTNVRFQVDEAAANILLKSTDLQFFSGITTGCQKSVETTALCKKQDQGKE